MCRDNSRNHLHLSTLFPFFAVGGRPDWKQSMLPTRTNTQDVYTTRFDQEEAGPVDNNKGHKIKG